MAETLFPVIDIPELIDDDGLYDYAYRPSCMWDMEKGDFVTDGSNRVIKCDGEEAYKIWCLKAVATERFTCLAYSDEIGAEMEAATKEPDIEAVKSAVERTISETLLVNPRTEYVRSFQFKAVNSKLLCTFVVKGVDIDEFAMTTRIGGGTDG